MSETAAPVDRASINQESTREQRIHSYEAEIKKHIEDGTDAQGVRLKDAMVSAVSGYQDGLAFRPSGKVAEARTAYLAASNAADQMNQPGKANEAYAHMRAIKINILGAEDYRVEIPKEAGADAASREKAIQDRLKQDLENLRTEMAMHFLSPYVEAVAEKRYQVENTRDLVINSRRQGQEAGMSRGQIRNSAFELEQAEVRLTQTETDLIRSTGVYGEARTGIRLEQKGRVKPDSSPIPGHPSREADPTQWKAQAREAAQHTTGLVNWDEVEGKTTKDEATEAFNKLPADKQTDLGGEVMKIDAQLTIDREQLSRAIDSANAGEITRYTRAVRELARQKNHAESRLKREVMVQVRTDRIAKKRDQWAEAMSSGNVGKMIGEGLGVIKLTLDRHKGNLKDNISAKLTPFIEGAGDAAGSAYDRATQIANGVEVVVIDRIRTAADSVNLVSDERRANRAARRARIQGEHEAYRIDLRRGWYEQMHEMRQDHYRKKVDGRVASLKRTVNYVTGDAVTNIAVGIAGSEEKKQEIRNKNEKYKTEREEKLKKAREHIANMQNPRMAMFAQELGERVILIDTPTETKVEEPKVDQNQPKVETKREQEEKRVTQEVAGIKTEDEVVSLLWQLQNQMQDSIRSGQEGKNLEQAREARRRAGMYINILQRDAHWYDLLGTDTRADVSNLIAGVQAMRRLSEGLEPGQNHLDATQMANELQRQREAQAQKLAQIREKINGRNEMPAAA